MKVLIDSYDTCCQNDSGGVQIRIKKIHELLNEKKIEAKLYNKFEDKIDDYDILHVFKLEYQKYSLIEFAKRKKKKIIISTIIHTKRNFKTKLYNIFAKFKFTTIYKLDNEILKLADFLICETPLEKKFLIEQYKINQNKIIVIPNSAECNNYKGNEIYKIVDRGKKYVIQVGVFDPNKNQLNVIRALKNTNIELVFIGGAYFGREKYYNDCIKEADGCANIHFLGWLDHNSKLLKSAYSHADTLILPSFWETFGMVAIEGVMNGTKLVLSNTISLLSFDEFKCINTFSPNDPEDIRRAIINTINSKKNDKEYDEIKRKFSWDMIVNEHIKIYARSLENEEDNTIFNKQD